MNRDEIRQHLLEHLKQSLVSNQISPGSIQLMGVYHHLAQFYPHPQASIAHRIVRDILQEFVNNNLLFIGYGDDQGFPWFTLTAYGVGNASTKVNSCQSTRTVSWSAYRVVCPDAPR